MDKPFALFCGLNSYPNGGMNDYHSSYATLKEAVAAAMDPNLTEPGPLLPGYPACLMQIDWYHIADLRTMLIVANEDGPVGEVA